MATVTKGFSPENGMPQTRVATWLALASVTAVTACAPKDAMCAATCGTVVVDISGAPETLLPVFAVSVDALAIGSLMFLPLAEIGDDLNFVGDEGFQPRIAQSWTFEDSVTIVFELDPRARWQDGRPVTARDVEFTFDLYRDPVINSNGADDLRSIRAVTARDDHTVALTFTRPYPEQFYDATYHTRIHPAHLLDTIPRASLRSHPMTRNPIGNGPYRFSRWDANQTVELVADTTFFLGRPGPARIVVQVVPDQNTIVSQLLAEEADFAIQIPPPSVDRVRQARHLNPIGYPSTAYFFVGFNFRDPDELSRPHPLFRHRYIREALSVAIDRESIAQFTFGEFAGVPSGPTSQANPLWNLDIPKIPYDTARARRLLAAQGWSDSDGDGILDRGGQPLAFELILPSSSPSRRQAATIMEEQLRRIGVEIHIRELEAVSHTQRSERGLFDATFFGWGQDPKPLGSISGTWGSEGANNYGRYSNPRFDSLLAATSRGTDAEQIRQTWMSAFSVIQNDWPAIWMLAPFQVSAVHTRLENVFVRPDQNWGATIWQWRVRPDQMLPRDRIGIR
jgi:peptide/nickel transport system substrate-binding protein